MQGLVVLQKDTPTQDTPPLVDPTPDMQDLLFLQKDTPDQNTP